MTHWKIIEALRDGLVKYRNPFAGTEAWFTPGRRHRPFHTDRKRKAAPLNVQQPQNYCAFCPAHYLQTTPEKSRLEKNGRQWRLFDRPTPDHVFQHKAEFRRIGNLFEIISFDYWRINYGCSLSKQDREHQQAYLSSATGREHIIALLEYKRKSIGGPAFRRNDMEQLQRLSASFFGGAHELIIPRRHYVDDARDTSQLCGSGDLSSQEHFYYSKLTIHSLIEIYRNNPFVQFVCVYTNWLRDAGASFEHCHRQLIGLDCHGAEIERGLKRATTTPRIFDDYAMHLAHERGFVICDNQHAVAIADIGRAFPAVAVFSKSANLRPDEHTAAEIRGVSDVVHAVHAAFGREKPLNEEWYYSPPSAITRLPWYIILKWRNHRLAGIEGITGLYPNEFSPLDIKEMLLPRLFDLRREQRIARVNIGDECKKDDAALNYWRARPGVKTS